MATLSVTNTFVDATPAEAAEVNENFDDVVTFVNDEVIHRDASIAFTAVPSGPSSDPSTANQFGRKSYIDAGDATNAAAISTHVSPRRGVILTANSDTVAQGATETITWGSESGDSDFWTSGNTVTIPSGAGGLYVVTLSLLHVSGSPTIVGLLTSSASSITSYTPVIPFGSVSAPLAGYVTTHQVWPLADAATITTSVRSYEGNGTVTFSARLSVFKVSA